MTCNVFKLLLVISLFAIAGCSEQIQIRDPWLRWMPPVSNKSVGYFEFVNETDSDIIIVSASSPRFGAIEIHTTEEIDGLKGMRRLPNVVVEAGKSVLFRPGGKHLMLFRNEKPLEEGELVEFTLQMEGRDPVVFHAIVRKEV